VMPMKMKMLAYAMTNATRDTRVWGLSAGPIQIM
jgi:hypothetical protein